MNLDLISDGKPLPSSSQNVFDQITWRKRPADSTECMSPQGSATSPSLSITHCRGTEAKIHGEDTTGAKAIADFRRADKLTINQNSGHKVFWALVKPTCGQLPLQCHAQGYATTFSWGLYLTLLLDKDTYYFVDEETKALWEQAICSDDGMSVVRLEQHIGLQVTK